MKILIAEDCIDTIEILSFFIKDVLPNVELNYHFSIKSLKDNMNKTKYDLIILDNQLQDGNIIDVFDEIREYYSCPIIMNSADMELNKKMKTKGANAYCSPLKSINIRDLICELLSL